MKEKATSSPSLSIILSIILLLTTMIGAAITIIMFLYKRHRSNSRVYQVNQNNIIARGHNEHPTGANVLQEEPMARPNGHQLRPLPLPPRRQISTVSTRSYVSARSSGTSFRWNIAYFLFKVLGSPPDDTESPAAADMGPSDQTPDTMLESRDRIERDDTDDSASIAAHTVLTEAGLDSPQYVNVNYYEFVGSGEQRTDYDDRNGRSTTTEFNKEEYLHVLS
jgi:hypothetical protein